MTKYIAALLLTVTAAHAETWVPNKDGGYTRVGPQVPIRTDKQTETLAHIQGAIWAKHNCRGVEVNTMEMIVELMESNLLPPGGDKSIFKEIEKGIDPEIDRLFKGDISSSCGTMWYSYGHPGNPSRGHLLYGIEPR